MIFHSDLGHALRDAYQRTPSCVCYTPGHGWAAYDPTKPILPAGSEIEFFIARRGRLPLPLTNDAVAAWTSLCVSRAREATVQPNINRAWSD
jgi:hypothetical protein